MRNLFNLFFVLFFYNVVAQQYISKDISQYKQKADFVVGNKSEFLKALETVKPYGIIYVKGSVDIDLSGEKDLILKEGIKLIGDRDLKTNVRGALLCTNKSGVHPFFRVVGNDVLIYGLTIKGDDGEIYLNKKDAFEGKSKEYIKENYLDLYYKNMYVTPVSSGIATNKKNLIIDNCELYQWTYTAVYVQKGAENIQIKNSYIHHNQRFGLGYGVTVDQGEAFIVGNTFNYNRHSIASTGRQGSKYVVERNIFYADGNNSWAVDMHGGKDRNDGTNKAGDYAIVKNNTFYLKGKGQAFVIRGKSASKSIVEGNIIYLDKNSLITKEKVIEQVNDVGNLLIKNNKIK